MIRPLMILATWVLAAPALAQAPAGVAGQADAAFARKDCAAAIPLYRRELAAGPGRALAQFNLGWCLNDQAKHAEAVPYLEAAVRANPQASGFAQELGYAHSRLGNTDKAIAWLDKALQLNPANSSAMVTLGNIHHGKDQHEQAVTWYRKALAIKPQPAMAHYRLGFSLNALKRYGEAIPALDQALKLDPKFANTYLELGFANEKLKRADEAIAWYTKAMAIDPKSHVPLNGVAGVYRDVKKDCTAAMTWYRKALALNSRERKANFGMGYCLNSQNQFAQALPYLQTAISSEPAYTAAYVEQGYSQWKLGQYPAAEASLGKALKLDAKNANALYYLGLIYTERGDRAGAERMAQALRALNSANAGGLQAKIDAMPR
jgi:tetratricopeptide (TPR) repeat protein